MIDRIRKLEIDLIREAQAARATLAGIFDASALAKATDALTFGCPECNAGGHTCPGDGNSIPHGAGSCGEHEEQEKTYSTRIAPGGFCIECLDETEDPSAWCDCGGDTERFGPCLPPCCSRAHTPDQCPARTEWVPSTFAHIEQGDHLRIGQDEATVIAVSKLDWHADNTDRYHPRAWEHVELRADLGFGMTPFPTSTAVEILCDPERKAQLIMGEAGLKPRYRNAGDDDA